MVRISKQAERRQRSHKRPKPPGKKTGPLKDNLPKGYKEHENALPQDLSTYAYIPKIR